MYMTYTTSGNPHHVGFPVHGRGFSHETCVTVSETGYLSFESRAPPIPWKCRTGHGLVGCLCRKVITYYGPTGVL